jgi:hypothetical protein
MMANSSTNNKFQQLISTLVELTSGTNLKFFKLRIGMILANLMLALRFLLAYYNNISCKNVKLIFVVRLYEQQIERQRRR